MQVGGERGLCPGAMARNGNQCSGFSARELVPLGSQRPMSLQTHRLVWPPCPALLPALPSGAGTKEKRAWARCPPCHHVWVWVWCEKARVCPGGALMQRLPH